MAHNKPVDTPTGAQAVGEAASKTHVLGTIFESASRAAATYNSPEFKNYESPGVRLFVDLTNVGAGPGTVTVKIQVKDPVSGNWKDLNAVATAVLNAVATTVLTVYPGFTTVANVNVDGHLGISWRVVATVATNAVVFSVGGEYLK